jgi:uncharacterized protein (DUF433 family)
LRISEAELAVALLVGVQYVVRDGEADVLEYLASGMTIDEILSDFPDLTREDVLACLAYAAARERGAIQLRA